MGSVVLAYSESYNRFFPLESKPKLTVQSRRWLLGTPLRYCVGGEYLYLPRNLADFRERPRMCWARLSGTCEYYLDHEGGGILGLGEHDIHELIDMGECSIGDRYIKRRKESEHGMVDVSSFCANELFNAIVENREVLRVLGKTDFENLCAEVFVRRGFQVDLFRSTKDDGIDFLAVQDGDVDPIVFAVQCKQPDLVQGKKQRTTGVAVVREIFGVSSAFDLHGAIAITGSRFSPAAKKFANLQPEKIILHDLKDLLSWIQQYRWNYDEPA